METPGQKTLFAIYKKTTGVNSTCVMRRIERDERNYRGEFCYKRSNKFNEVNFDEVLDYDDIEIGMEIMVSNSD
jgi:hypothetical protein